MKMKVLLYLIMCSLLNAGSREDGISLEFQKCSKELTSATGWKKNSTTSKWIENQNAISDSKITNTDYSKSHLYQNFDYLKMCTINYNSNIYYVLLYKKNSGFYEYPAIREGWINYKETRFIIFDNNQFNQLKESINNYKDNKNLILESHLYGEMSNAFSKLGGQYAYNNEILMAKITNVLKGLVQNYGLKELFEVKSLIDDGKIVVRFHIPGSLGLAGGINWDYFETPKSSFDKLLIF